MCKNTAFKQCMDLYIYVGESIYEFKQISPVLCPSVLLAIKGQKDKFSHTFVGFFVCGMMGRLIYDITI